MKTNSESKKIAALLATTALALGVTGLGANLGNPLASVLTTSVLGGISVNVASGYIDRLKYGKLREWFIKPHPDDLNHDLQKALLAAIIQGVDNVAILYSSLLDDGKRKKFNKLIKELTDSIKNDFPVGQSDTVTKTQLNKLLYKDAEQAKTELVNTIPTQFKSLDQLNKDVPFSSFFKEHILAQFQLCFGEILKDEEHAKVWVAFQRFLLEDIKEKVELVLEKQDAILDNINELKKNQQPISEIGEKELSQLRDVAEKLNQPITLTSELENALDDFIKGIKVDIQQLLQQQAEQYKLQKDHFDLTKQIDGRVSVFGDKLDKKFTRKKLVLISLVIVALVIIVGAMGYSSYTQPFNTVFVLSIYPDFDTADYMPLNSKAKLVLYTDNKYKENVSAEYKATFLEIQKKHLGEPIRVELEDELWQTINDSIILNEGVNKVTIIPNDKWAKLKGTVKYNRITQIDSRAAIKLNDDTVIYTTEQGDFEITLPIKMRKRVHSFELYYKNKLIKKDKIYPLSHKPIYIKD